MFAQVNPRLRVREVFARCSRKQGSRRAVPAAAFRNPLSYCNGEGRNRTGDTTIFSRVLYQLSYLAARRQW